MQIVSTEQFLKEHGENALHTQNRRRNPVWDVLDSLEVGQTIIFEKGEWKLNNQASKAVGPHYRKTGRKFHVKRMADGREVIARYE